MATPYVEPMLAAVLRQAEAEFDVEAYRSEYWDARGYFLIPTYSFRIPIFFWKQKKSFVVGKVGRAVKHLVVGKSCISRDRTFYISISHPYRAWVFPQIPWASYNDQTAGKGHPKWWVCSVREVSSQNAALNLVKFRNSINTPPEISKYLPENWPKPQQRKGSQKIVFQSHHFSGVCKFAVKFQGLGCILVHLSQNSWWVKSLGSLTPSKSVTLKHLPKVCQVE